MFKSPFLEVENNAKREIYKLANIIGQRGQ